MTKSNRFLTISAGIGLSLSVLFDIFLAFWNPPIREETVILWFGLLCLGWFPLMLASVLWLIWKSRKLWATSLAWTSAQGLVLLAFAATNIKNSSITMSVTLALPVIILGNFAIDILHACQRLASLRLIATGTIGLVLGYLAAALVYPNILDILMSPSSASTFWWLGALQAIFAPMILSGGICFFFEIAWAF